MRYLPAVYFTVLLLPSAVPAQFNSLPALQARKVLKKHCAACHHGEGSEYRLFDVGKHDTLVKDSDDGKAVVVAKKLDESLLWQRAGVRKSMPPRSVKERPSDAELDIVRRWIEGGAAAFPPNKPREFISLEKTLTLIRDDLREADKDNRPYLRYFTLTHLHNNPEIEDEELRGERAALSMAINSLTWKPHVLPKALDKEQTVFVVNLKALDWDRHDIWLRVLQEYPYGLNYASHRDAKVKRLGQDINEYTIANTFELAIVRADWFVANATRPPLYYDILQLPNNLEHLEKELLKVSVEANFLDNKLVRAGFAASGVSGQNRLVERHDSPVGIYYWKSYDFKPRKARSNLNRFPLGPVFHGNIYNEQAFSQDGGEMIFGLPNGMQAYFLTDGKGKRIDEGPTDVVNDALKTSGTPAIVNGLSCMHCHKHGMIPFVDTVRAGHALSRSGKPGEKVEQLYPEANVMNRLLKDDEDRFVTALEKIIGPFLQVEEDKKAPIRGFINPIGETARRYLKDVTVGMAAYELGLDKPEEFGRIIRTNKQLQTLGLLPLAGKKPIKRADWETIDGRSLYQEVAMELSLGSVINYPKGRINP